MRFTIDLKKSVFENAKFHYEESKKARQKAEGARKAIEDTLKKIRELEKNHDVSKSKVETKKKIVREKKWYERFRWFYSSDKFLVVGGKDSTSNEILIKNHLEKNDLVFHADVHGAPFIIIKNPENVEIPERTKEETAQISGVYSSAWKSGIGSTDVYYVHPEQISKTPPSGEYIAKGAFMIYGKKEWFRGVKLEITIGLKINDDVMVIAGLESAVIPNSDYHVKIGIGDEKSGELSKKIKEVMMKKSRKEDSEKIKKLDIQEIQRFIPAGKGRLIG